MSLGVLKKLALLFFLILGLFVGISRSYAAEDNPCLSEDAYVRLVGTIHSQTFPGPPNYESIKKGDKAETYWIFESTHPICISTEGLMHSFQLIVDPAVYKNRNLLKERVRVEGVLTPQVTGHHHTPFLIDVKEIQAAN